MKYFPESLPPWLPRLRSTTKEQLQPTTGKEASPPTTITAVEDDDDDEDIADGILPVDANSVANAKLVGAGGVDQSRVVISGGESSVGGG